MANREYIDQRLTPQPKENIDAWINMQWMTLARAYADTEGKIWMAPVFCEDNMFYRLELFQMEQGGRRGIYLLTAEDGRTCEVTADLQPRLGKEETRQLEVVATGRNTLPASAPDTAMIRAPWVELDQQRYELGRVLEDNRGAAYFVPNIRPMREDGGELRLSQFEILDVGGARITTAMWDGSGFSGSMERLSLYLTLNEHHQPIELSIIGDEYRQSKDIDDFKYRDTGSATPQEVRRAATLILAYGRRQGIAMCADPHAEVQITRSLQILNRRAGSFWNTLNTLISVFQHPHTLTPEDMVRHLCDPVTLARSPHRMLDEILCQTPYGLTAEEADLMDEMFHPAESGQDGATADIWLAP